jgi:hypothetical protein
VSSQLHFTGVSPRTRGQRQRDEPAQAFSVISAPQRHLRFSLGHRNLIVIFATVIPVVLSVVLSLLLGTLVSGRPQLGVRTWAAPSSPAAGLANPPTSTLPSGLASPVPQPPTVSHFRVASPIPQQPGSFCSPIKLALRPPSGLLRTLPQSRGPTLSNPEGSTPPFRVASPTPSNPEGWSRLVHSRKYGRLLTLSTPLEGEHEWSTAKPTQRRQTVRK